MDKDAVCIAKISPGEPPSYHRTNVVRHERRISRRARPPVGHQRGPRTVSGGPQEGLHAGEPALALQ